MVKQREEITEEVNREIELLRNQFDMVQLLDKTEFTKIDLVIPYCNGQITALQMTLQGDIDSATRYRILIKLIAYFVYMLELIQFPDPVIEEEPNEDLGDPFPI
jgi:hypothetical protein